MVHYSVGKKGGAGLTKLLSWRLTLQEKKLQIVFLLKYTGMTFEQTETRPAWDQREAGMWGTEKTQFPIWAQIWDDQWRELCRFWYGFN